MYTKRITKLWFWLLGILLVPIWLTYSHISHSQSPSNNGSLILQELSQANVVYLGETHDKLEDHKAQLEIIQALHQRHPQIAIAMEMFQRPDQAIIDQYLAGKLTQNQLLEQTQYKQRWGFPWDFYAPIVNFAKDNQLPVLALNAPTEIVRKVARQGLEALTADEQKQIPPLKEIRTDNADYRQMIQNIYDEIHQGHGQSANFEQFFLVQVLWDETMAETIAQFVKSNPQYQVVVLAGKGHIVYGYGIRDRVARRIGNESFVQRSVLFSPPQNQQSPSKVPIADFFWH